MPSLLFFPPLLLLCPLSRHVQFCHASLIMSTLSVMSTLPFQHQLTKILTFFSFASGMTPLHCAAISHGATMKAFSTSGLTDVSLQTKAAEKLSCVQMLLTAGASLCSQVQYISPPFLNVTSAVLASTEYQQMRGWTYYRSNKV